MSSVEVSPYTPDTCGYFKECDEYMKVCTLVGCGCGPAYGTGMCIAQNFVEKLTGIAAKVHEEYTRMEAEE